VVVVVAAAVQCLFMLLLLLIAKGWTITLEKLDAFSKLFLFTVWAAYSAASIALFLWNQVYVVVVLVVVVVVSVCCLGSLQHRHHSFHSVESSTCRFNEPF